jgi:hypothetical protein
MRLAQSYAPQSSEEVQMKAAVVSLALFGTEIAPISGHVPEMKVDALCKARSAGDKLMGLPEAQSIADCVRDETAAKEKLSAVWGTTSRSIRNRCQRDAVALGIRSYLDLLTCIQMADDVKSPSPITKLKSTSRHRNAK